MFGPDLLHMFETHAERYTPPIAGGTRLKSKWGTEWLVLSVHGDNVTLKKLGAKSTTMRPKQQVFKTTRAAIERRLRVV